VLSELKRKCRGAYSYLNLRREKTGQRKTSGVLLCNLNSSINNTGVNQARSMRSWRLGTNVKNEKYLQKSVRKTNLKIALDDLKHRCKNNIKCLFEKQLLD
jgi:hypothetical protein